MGVAADSPPNPIIMRSAFAFVALLVAFATVQSCPLGQFECGNGRCIPGPWRCDFDNDCDDSSDEQGCDYPACNEQQFTCANTGRCINASWQCDFDNDCGDNSDEEGCERSECNESEFRCASGRCINGNWECDGDNDCRDNSDEANCPGGPRQSTGQDPRQALEGLAALLNALQSRGGP